MKKRLIICLHICLLLLANVGDLLNCCGRFSILDGDHFWPRVSDSRGGDAVERNIHKHILPPTHSLTDWHEQLIKRTAIIKDQYHSTTHNKWTERKNKMENHKRKPIIWRWKWNNKCNYHYKQITGFISLYCWSLLGLDQCSDSLHQELIHKEHCNYVSSLKHWPCRTVKCAVNLLELGFAGSCLWVFGVFASSIILS